MSWKMCLWYKRNIIWNNMVSKLLFLIFRSLQFQSFEVQVTIITERYTLSKWYPKIGVQTNRAARERFDSSSTRARDRVQNIKFVNLRAGSRVWIYIYIFYFFYSKITYISLIFIKKKILFYLFFIFFELEL